MLAQFREKRSDVGVFEILSNDGELEIPEAPDEADEFEIAEMGGDPDSTGLSSQSLCRGIVELDLHMLFPVGGSQAARPEKIDEGAGKILVGLSGDEAPLLGRVLLTESGPQVFQGGASAAGVKQVGDATDAPG